MRGLIRPASCLAHLPFTPQLQSQWLSSQLPLCHTLRIHHTRQRRNFITLPQLPQFPDLLKPILSSRQYKDRILVKYSQREFYDLVANVDEYQEFLPWCTHSEMSALIPAEAERDPTYGTAKDFVRPYSDLPHGPVVVRHGELGIGFNSLQERYVSTVTYQEPWAVRAVSYDSKLFKELSTTWRFTPNVPTSTTLQATLDHELQEPQLLTRPTQEQLRPSPPTQQAPPVHQFTAAAVFGAAAVPKIRKAEQRPTTVAEPIPVSPQLNGSMPLPTKLNGQDATQHRPLPTPPTHMANRTASPSNLATMKPSDYPSCWVDFEIQFEFASPVHASISSLFFDQVSKEMLKAFIQRAEVLYGQR
ncbi:Coenzyme Q-binding protein coq10a, mitochondrial [Dissophora globulifera]|uniref:Coenzyme Q-binding protein coq10a, mitochondrial n=1 Tax=Dissophora globulifera TaxID=979702 RepID=A0A9P6RVV0_9FUNG|nr:Coenzyme Q-binding protein coq10a, mitochondrial [Dissophora globulifera]